MSTSTGTHFKGIVYSELGFSGPGTVPAGGLFGQVLTKNGPDDYDYSWVNPGAGGGFPLLAPDGSSSAPSYNFANDTALGIYRSANDTMGFAANGSLSLTISPTAVAPIVALTPIAGDATNPAISWGGSGIFQSSYGLLNFTTSGVERLRLENNGDVIVGPGGSGVLTVNGPGNFTGNISAANYPPPPPTGNTNTAAYYNASNDLDSWAEFQRDTFSGGLNFNISFPSNNEVGGFQAHQWTFTLDPIANSPNQSWNVHNIGVNIDPNSTGFQMGTAGQAVNIINAGFQHQGTGDTGVLGYLNFNSNLGNGTDPITIKTMSGIFVGSNWAANTTIDGQLQSFNSSHNFDSGSFGTSNFSFTEFQLGSNIQIPLNGYVGINAGMQIAEISNNHNYQFLNLNPTITNFDGNAGFTGLGIYGNYGTFDTGSWQGIRMNPTVSSVVNAVGLSIDMSSVTASGTKQAINVIGDVAITGGLQFSGALSVGQFQAFYASNPVDGGGNPQGFHGLISSITAQNGVTTANADAIGVNTAMLITLEDNSVSTSGPFQLGFAALALPCVIETHTGSTLDYMSAATYAMNFSGTSTGGTIDTVNIGRALAIPNGITTVNKLRGWYYHEPFGGIGTVRHGIYIEDAPDNYLENALLIGGTPISDDQVTNTSVALEIKSTTRAFLNARMTTTERDALTAVNGMQIYNTTTDTMQAYIAGSWTDL